MDKPHEKYDGSHSMGQVPLGHLGAAGNTDQPLHTAGGRKFCTAFDLMGNDFGLTFTGNSNHSRDSERCEMDFATIHSMAVGQESVPKMEPW